MHPRRLLYWLSVPAIVTWLSLATWVDVRVMAQPPVTSDRTEVLPRRTDEPPRPRIFEQQPPVIYAPDENGTPTLLLNVPLSQIQRLMDRADDRLEGPGAPPQFQVDRLQIQGTTVESAVQLDVAVTVKVLPPQDANGGVADEGVPTWTRIPLRFHDASLLSPAEHEGAGQLYLVFDPTNGYQGWLRHQGEGTHEIRLRLAVPLRQASDATQLRFFPPLANQSSMALDLQGENVAASIENGRNLTVQELGDGRSQINAEDLRNLVVIDWRLDGNLSARQPTYLDVRGDIRITIDGPGAIRGNVTLDLQSYGRAIEQFTLQLPPDTKIVSGDQPGYSLRELSDAETATDTGSQVEITLEKPAPQTRFQFATQTTLAADRPDPVNVAKFEVIGAIQQRGRVRLLTSEEWLVYWTLGPSVRRVQAIETFETNQERRLLASFQYFRQPCRLDVEIKPQDTRISVQPDYQMHVSEDRVTLQARLNYNIRGARVSFLDMSLNGWELDDIGPIGAVENDDLNETAADPIKLRLTQASTPDLTLTMTLHRPLPPESAGVQFRLPWPAADSRSPGTLRVTSDPSVVMSFDEGMSGLAPDPLLESYQAKPTIDTNGIGTATPANGIPNSLSSPPNGVAPTSNGGSPSSPSPMPLATTTAAASPGVGAVGLPGSATWFRVLASTTTPELEITYEIRSQEIRVATDSVVDLTLDSAQVEQRWGYQVRYEPAARITLMVPRELLQRFALPRYRGQVELRLDDQVLATDWYQEGAEAFDTTRSLVAVNVALDRPRLGGFELALRYGWNLRPAGPAGYCSVPLVVPRDVDTISNRVTLTPIGPVRVEPADDENWTQDDDLTADTSLQSIGLTEPTNAEMIRLRVAQLQEDVNSEVATVTATIVDRAWLQTWFSTDRRMDRMVFRILTGADSVVVVLPESAGLAAALVNGAPVSASPRGNRLEVPLPRIAAGEHTVEISLDYASRPALGSMTIQMPTLAGATGPRTYFWQLLVPRDEHLWSADARLTSANGWTRSRWFWHRQGSHPQQNLEFWTRASTQPPIPDGLNRYLFSSFVPLEEFRVRTVHRRTLVTVASTFFLMFGISFLYVPILRHPVVILSMATFVVALAWIFADTVLLVAQACLLGIMLVVVAMIATATIRWWQARRNASRRRPQSDSRSNVSTPWREAAPATTTAPTPNPTAVPESKA